MSLEFEWDAQKAFENLKRHRINFDQASAVFDDPDAFETFDDSQHYGEDRFPRVGMSGGKLVSVTYTNRAGRIRIISARKASTNEKEDYRHQTGR